MRHQRGFTLFEVMVALSILSLLAYMGSAHVRDFSASLADKRALQASLKNLSAGLLQARQLAIANGQNSFLCGGIDCSGDWSYGYQIFETQHSSTPVQQGRFPDNLLVRWQGFPAQKSFIEFKANGLSAYQNGSFVLCIGQWQARIIVNQSGRFYLDETLPVTACA